MNSKECEWADVELFTNGVLIGKCRAVDYGRRVEKEHLHAAGREAVSIQQGNETYSGTVTLLKNAVDALDRAARLAGGKDLLDAEFLLVVNYRPFGQRLISTDTLEGCQFTENVRAIVQNAKFMEISLPFLYMNQLSI